MSNNLTPITRSNISTLLTQIVQYVGHTGMIPGLHTSVQTPDGINYSVVESVDQIPLASKDAVNAWMNHIVDNTQPECVYPIVITQPEGVHPIVTAVGNEPYSIVFDRYNGQLIRLTGTAPEGELITLYQFGDKDLDFTDQIAIPLFESHQKLKTHLTNHVSFKHSMNLDSRHSTLV